MDLWCYSRTQCDGLCEITERKSWKISFNKIDMIYKYDKYPNGFAGDVSAKVVIIIYYIDQKIVSPLFIHRVDEYSRVLS